MTPADVDPEDVERLIAEDDAWRAPGADPLLAAIGRAILLEDAFGVTFTDDDLAGPLQDRAAVVATVLRRTRAADREGGR